jgi:hypothetical protein
MTENTLNYFGKIDEHCIVEFVDLLNGILTRSLGPRKDLRKICSFAIELLDNGMRYSIDENISFSWKIEKGSITFQLENKAEYDDAMRLKKQAAHFHQMNDEERKEEFKKQITDPSFTKKGGAGLGLLQMLRKGAISIDINVEPAIDGDYVCISKIQTPLNKNLQA